MYFLHFKVRMKRLSEISFLYLARILNTKIYNDALLQIINITFVSPGPEILREDKGWYSCIE